MADRTAEILADLAGETVRSVVVEPGYGGDIRTVVLALDDRTIELETWSPSGEDALVATVLPDAVTEQEGQQSGS